MVSPWPAHLDAEALRHFEVFPARILLEVEQVIHTGASEGLDAAEWAMHCRPELSRQGTDDVVHPVQRWEDEAGRPVPPGRAALAVRGVPPPVHGPLGQRLLRVRRRAARRRGRIPRSSSVNHVPTLDAHLSATEPLI
jgi:hypothetical protein